MSWKAAQWALTEAPMPKSDPTARLVLAHLAEKSDKNGRNAFPQIHTVAHDLDLDPQTVSRVLKRLSAYGLITRVGMGPQGQTKWELHLDQRRGAGSFDEFMQRHRERATAKKSRWRQDKPVHDDESWTRRDVHDDESWTVHDRESGTSEDVHDDESACPRSSVVLSTTMNPHVHDREYPRNHQENRQENRQENHHTAPSARAGADAPACEPESLDIEAPQKPPSAKRGKGQSEPDPETFNRFWSAYPRKAAKPAARKAFTKASKNHDPEKLITEAQRWAGLWHAAGVEQRYIPHPATWLNGERWTDEEPPPRSSTGARHRPYHDPTDQSVYDEPLL